MEGRGVPGKLVDAVALIHSWLLALSRIVVLLAVDSALFSIGIPEETLDAGTIVQGGEGGTVSRGHMAHVADDLAESAFLVFFITLFAHSGNQ